MTLFTDKYRVESARLKNWDYLSNGYYFVTICTKNSNEYWFGDVQNKIMGLSDIGCIATNFWQEIPKHFNNVILDEWIVMPNHVHGIIKINKPLFFCSRDAINRVSTTKKQININKTGGITGQHNPMGKQTLGEIIRWYKGRCSYEIHKNHTFDFQWQPRFHDHIIRNNDELNKIQKYILKNPSKWELDRNNPQNLWM